MWQLHVTRPKCQCFGISKHVCQIKVDLFYGLRPLTIKVTCGWRSFCNTLHIEGETLPISQVILGSGRSPYGITLILHKFDPSFTPRFLSYHSKTFNALSLPSPCT